LNDAALRSNKSRNAHQIKQPKPQNQPSLPSHCFAFAGAIICYPGDTHFSAKQLIQWPCFLTGSPGFLQVLKSFDNHESCY
jgi:hypothetical protein